MPTLSEEQSTISKISLRGIILGLLGIFTLLLFMLSYALHHDILFFLSVSTHAVIGQFSELCSTVLPAKLKAVFVDKMFRY